MDQTAAPRPFLFSDLWWLAGIAFFMATSGLWGVLSPRPDIGQVAVLWLPSAVLMVALLRNCNRPFFVALALAVFYGVGLASSLANDTWMGAFALLSLDVVEVGSIVLGLRVLGGPYFQLASAMNVGFFVGVTVAATAICGVGAALLSAFPIGPNVIASNAPVQVGVAWFTSNLATYLLAATPLICLTGMDRGEFMRAMARHGIGFAIVGISVAILTLIGHVLPQYLLAQTGLNLGSGGLVLIAFPLATYFAFQYGPVLASLCGALIGIPTIYATMAGFGPFGSGDATGNIFEMQATLIVCTFTLLLIGAMAEQMRARTRALEKSLNARLVDQDFG